MRFRSFSAGLNWLADWLAILAAAVVAAAPAWADPAQDAAAAQIETLSSPFPGFLELEEFPNLPYPVHQITLTGCSLSISDFVSMLGPEGFLSRLTVDLSQDRYRWAVLRDGDLGGPASTWALSFEPATGDGFLREERNIAQIGKTLNDLRQATDPTLVTELRQDWARQEPVSYMTMWGGEFIYYDPPDSNRIEDLKIALDTHVRDWCDPDR